MCGRCMCVSMDFCVSVRLYVCMYVCMYVFIYMYPSTYTLYVNDQAHKRSTKLRPGDKGEYRAQVGWFA